MDRRRPVLAILALTLAAFVGVTYGRALRLPFIGDDYVFLDRVLRSSFLDLWSRSNADFGWYRPWSRDFHFWSVVRLVGISEPAFRAINDLLWASGMLLYAAVVERVTGARVAAISTLGLAALALWGSPVIWISGSQDLWMFLSSMASLLLFITQRSAWSAIALAVALLSKETAAVVPVIAIAHGLLVDRCGLRTIVRRAAPLLLVTLAWGFLHPALFARPLGHRDPRFPSVGFGLIRSLLATINVDRWPMPRDVGPIDAVAWIASVAIITASAWLLLREARDVVSGRRGRRPGARGAAHHPWPIWLFGLVWGLIGLLPVFVPSTGWRAYYTCLGAAGFWLAWGVWLARSSRLAMVTIAAIAALRGAEAYTPSWEWTESYLIRAGHLLEAIRSRLTDLHPTLPSHTRVYFARLPNNIGLVAGRTSSLGVWYRDPTVQGRFYNSYRPRTRVEPPGEDLFFHFDSTRVLEEVIAGPEDVAAAAVSNPEWEQDHEKLSMLFLRSGDVARAAVEFEKLAQLPSGAKATMFAAVCREALGDSARADSLFHVAQLRNGNPSWSEIMAWRDLLRASMPGRAVR